jgi:peptide/nickel transport system permease protein
LLLLLGKRLIQLVVVFIVVTFFTVMLISLVPGKLDVVVIPFDNPAQTARAQFRKDNHLDRPLVVQWGIWAEKFVKGDFGNVYNGPTGTIPVKPQITAALPVSGLLILYSQILSLAIAIPLGVFSAYRAGSRLDRVLNTTAFAFIAMPSFAVALILTYYLGVKAGLVPTRGYTRPTQDLGKHFQSVVVPVIALSLGQIAVYMRLLRTDLVATLQEDFILMAKSKGISNSRVLWRHALRPSSLTLLTVAGLNIGTLIGCTLVVEFLLSIPGMGLLIGQGVLGRQYILLESCVAIIALFFVSLNFLIDFLYNVLDPRIREQAS